MQDLYQLSVEWQTWVRHNLTRGCLPNDMAQKAIAEAGTEICAHVLGAPRLVSVRLNDPVVVFDSFREMDCHQVDSTRRLFGVTPGLKRGI